MYFTARENQENEGQEDCIMSSDSEKPTETKPEEKTTADSKPVVKKPEE